VNFPTSASSQGGTNIGTEKGGGKGTKGIVGSYSENRGVPWFVKVGRTQSSGV